jgi:hypothetical protein
MFSRGAWSAAEAAAGMARQRQKSSIPKTIAQPIFLAKGLCASTIGTPPAPRVPHLLLVAPFRAGRIILALQNTYQVYSYFGIDATESTIATMHSPTVGAGRTLPVGRTQREWPIGKALVRIAQHLKRWALSGEVAGLVAVDRRIARFSSLTRRRYRRWPGNSGPELFPRPLPGLRRARRVHTANACRRSARRAGRAGPTVR